MLTVKVDNGRITRYIVGALLLLPVYLGYIWIDRLWPITAPCHVFFGSGRVSPSPLIDLWPAKCGRGWNFSGDKYRREIFISPRPKTPAAWNLFTHWPWPWGPMIPEERLLFSSFSVSTFFFFSLVLLLLFFVARLLTPWYVPSFFPRRIRRRCHATSTKVDRNRAQSKRNRRIDWWNGWPATGNIFSIINSVAPRDAALSLYSFRARGALVLARGTFKSRIIFPTSCRAKLTVFRDYLSFILD